MEINAVTDLGNTANFKVIAMSGQTYLDLAIQESGSLEAAFALGQLNGQSITTELVQGSQIQIPGKPVDRVIRKAFQDNGWKPASAKTLPGTISPDTSQGKQGIGYWKIGVDFKVS